MSADYDDNGSAIRYCRECDDPTEGDPNLCWGCDPQVLAKREGMHVEWGYSEDDRPSPRGSKSTKDDPDAERWARQNAAKWAAEGGRVFARAASDWIEMRDE